MTRKAEPLRLRPEYVTRDRDTTRPELANFDQFLDSHRETAEQLRKDPSLVNNEQFVKSHPDLQAYLQQHPEVREEVKENPNAFMHQEARYERTEDATATRSTVTRDRDTTRHELANFDQFLDSHRETAEQLRKDPSLVNNEQFVKSLILTCRRTCNSTLKYAKKLRRTLTRSCTRKLAMNAPKTLLPHLTTAAVSTATLPAANWPTSTNSSTATAKRPSSFAKTLHS